MSDQLMLSAEDFPAKISATLAGVTALPVIAQVFGVSLQDSFARYDQASSSWKTFQRSLLEEWARFSGTWPASGTMRNGQVYRRVLWVRHTCDSECSLWPTPTASMDGRGFGIPLHNQTRRYRQSIVLKVQDLVGEHGWRIHPNFTEVLMGLPKEWTVTGQQEIPSCRKS